MHLNKVLPLIAPAVFVFTISCYGKQQPTHANSGFAVVELFTSEGCSSCPAAEWALAQVYNEYKQDVYVLEFHVDYWNYLGWNDVYSNKEFSERQQHYANLMHLNSAYTPQAIVNGKNELVGSDKTALYSTINNNLQKKQAASLQISAKAGGGNISISYNLSNYKGQLLNIALVQKKAERNVKKGENSGRKLQHINVVRVLRTIDVNESRGVVGIALPGRLNSGDCTIIAYTQAKDTWEITGAGEVINWKSD